MNTEMSENNPNDERRLSGVARLYGDQAYQTLQTQHVAVIGIGGVGSWAAEALARSAIGKMTLIDFDQVSISNTNRQIHALEGEYGKAKISVMAQRLIAINPDIQVEVIDDFLKPENFQTYLNKEMYVLDAMDDVPTKIALAAWCKKNDIPLVMSGGAGGKLDPSQATIADLSRATHDPILSKIRAALRKQYGFEKDPKKKMQLRVVFSPEPRLGVSQGGLSCSGYGSSVMVTATFGLIAAAEIVRQILSSHKAV
jgi:tRNA threonylcarbamoyladenosine dehydratase